MDARYTRRKAPVLEECQVVPAVFAQVMPRLRTLMAPCVDTLHGQAPRAHVQTSVRGLLSAIERTNVAALADHCGQERLGLQGFIGWGDGDDAPRRQGWRAQVGQQRGQEDGVLVFDPSACPKSGHESGGVARQGGGRLGQVDHCQVALSLGDVSRQGHTLVDLRLSLPQEWTQDKARLDQAGVPTTRRGYRTRHQVALEMLATNGAALPHGWMAGDDERGRPYWCRRRLVALGERYVLAGPSKTWCRELESPLPPYGGLGRRPQRPWQHVAVWSPALDEAAWRRVDVRAGSTGPLVVEVVTRRVVSRTHRRQQGDEELVVVRRSRDRDHHQVVQGDDSLSTAAPETPRWALARGATAAQRIAACLQRSTSEAGVADDAVRHGTGWQQHHTRSFLATWFLERATHRGEKTGRLHSRDPRSVKASRSSGARRFNAARGRLGSMNARSAYGAMSWLASIPGNSVTYWLH